MSHQHQEKKDLSTTEETISVTWRPEISGLIRTGQIRYFGYQPKLAVCVIVVKRGSDLLIYSGQNLKRLVLAKFSNYDRTNQKYFASTPEGEFVYAVGRPFMTTLKNLPLNEHKPIIKELS